MALVKEAALAALSEAMDVKHVEWRHFESASHNITPQITADMLAFYTKFAGEARV